MNRRNFLRVLAGAIATPAVARTYFLPPIGGWTSDIILHRNPITEYVLHFPVYGRYQVSIDRASTHEFGDTKILIFRRDPGDGTWKEHLIVDSAAKR
jgi:hypothetical protein